MAVELNHTIVPAHDPRVSAQFLADILGLPVDPPVAHFTPVTLANGVTLDFDRYDHVDEHHYAFQLSDEEFEAAFGRIVGQGITYYADPACHEPGQVYTNGRRGTYFRDPNGHLMEILTPIPGERARSVNQAAMRRRARIMRAVNVPMRAALSLPFATPLNANLMLIFYTGRKSGKAYRQPVSYVRDGDVLLTPGGGRWTLNLASGRPVRIRLRGRYETARPELVTDPAEVERLLAVISEKNPRATRFIPIPRRPGGRLDPEALDAALRHGFCIVRWHLAR